MKGFLPFVALGFATATAAQDAPLVPGPAPAAEVVAITPDKTARMTVPVSIGDKGPFAFVVDTGAERTVISRELADRLALDSGGSATLHSMTGTEEVRTVVIPSLSVSASPVAAIRAPALSEFHIGAAGLIGIDSLRDQRVTLNFKAGTMTITPGERRMQRRSDPDEIVVTARSKFGQLILVGATVNGRKVDVVVDTGSQVSVGNTALRKLLVGNNGRHTPQPIELIGVTGMRAGADYTFAREIKIGGASIRNMPIAFVDARIFKTLQLTRRPAMMLGMDALRMFDRVSVDFASKKVKLLLPDGADRDTGSRLAVREPERSPAI